MTYVVKRTLQAVVAALGVSTIVFFMLHLSGDPVQLMVPQNSSAEDIARLRSQLGLDRPLLVQYLDYMGSLLRADLGYSYIQNRPVVDIVLERLPYTLYLAIAAFLLALVTGVVVGMVTAVYRGRLAERLLMPLVLLGQSLPSFWIGILLILFFSVRLGWLPSSGVNGLPSLILPTITLASLSAATIARITRSSVMEQLGAEYVTTARSKGAGTSRLLVRHVMRNASIPILTLVALDIAALLGGAVITETVFAWPGLGQLTIQAIEARDFPLVQAIVLLGSVTYILINLATDLLYSAIDPRIRLGRST